MPKKATTKKPTNKPTSVAPEVTKAPAKPLAKAAKAETAAKTPPAPAKDAPLALRLAVLEDVVRRAAQDTRAFQTKLDTFAASQTELARRVADVEKRAT